MNDYAKDGGPGEVWLLCSFYHDSLRTWIETIVNKFAVSNHMALILGVRAPKSYLKLTCEYELHSLPNKKVSGAKDPGKNYIKVRPPLVRYLLLNRLFICKKWPKSAHKKTSITQRISYGFGMLKGQSLNLVI